MSSRRAIVLACVVATMGFARPIAAATEPVKVRISGVRFEPKIVHVRRGQPIVWTNEDAFAHTVTSGTSADDGVWPSSPSLGEGETFALTLEKPGRYPYFCKPHFYATGMHATIVVDP